MDKKRYLVCTLACLASKRLQEKYIANATTDSYLLTTDLVNDALTAWRYIEHDKESDFTDLELNSVSNFVSSLQHYNDAASTTSSLYAMVGADKIKTTEWKDLVNGARICLSDLGVVDMAEVDRIADD